MAGFGSPIAMFSLQAGQFNGGSLVWLMRFRVGKKAKYGDFHTK